MPVSSHIIPYEIYGQTVYGRVINPERADIAILNDHSEIVLDGFRIEGSGTALKCINGAKTQINLFDAGLGIKKEQNPTFDLENAVMELNGAWFFGTRERDEYNILISERNNETQSLVTWDDMDEFNTAHRKIIQKFV